MSEVLQGATPAPGDVRPGGQPPGGRRSAADLIPDPDVERTVHHYALALVGQAGITESDVEDIEQDLRGALLAALPGFDPGKSKLSTFATRVIERRSVDILRHRMVELRAFNGPMRSLEDEIETDDGPQLLLEAVTRADNDRRFNCVPVDTDDARCLAMDLNDLVPLLPPDLRKLHEDLKTKSVTQIAAEQNVHRRSIDRRKARLRRWLERRSLQDYLKSTRALLARETNERNGDT